MRKLHQSSGQTDYAIGKGRPPRHSRWKKGISGNPGGKKKGTINLERAFQEALLRQITVTVNGEKTNLSVLEVLVMRLLDTALKGDIKAINSVLDRIERLIGSNQKQGNETSEEDIEILQRVLAKRDFTGLANAVLKRTDAGEETEGVDSALDDLEVARD
jgi:hypothetical protein